MNNNIIVKWIPFLEELFTKWRVDPDCQQMIYLDLLLYDYETLKKLDENKQIKFWLVRFVKNYWFSETSRYHYQYRKYYERYKPFPEEDEDD